MASTGRAFGLPFMRNSDIRYADTVPSAVGGITRFACEYAKEHGIDVEALLQKSGLTFGQIEQPSVRLSVRSQIKFLELAARAFQDDFLGFHLAQKFELRAIGLLYYVLASSDTLDEALQRAARYSTIVNEGIVLKFRNGKESGIAFEYVGVARRTDRHQIEFWMTALVRICRQLTGRRLPASRVQVAHQRSGDTSEMSAFFGGDVMFGAPVDEVAFPESSTPVALVGADSYLNQMLVKYCEEALARRETNRSPFGLKVENAITLLLPHGKARVGEVARKLGVSQRTLARRLASEGQTFAGVLQSLRSDLAKRHLADEGLSISQIAWLLGTRMSARSRMPSNVGRAGRPARCGRIRAEACLEQPRCAVPSHKNCRSSSCSLQAHLAGDKSICAGGKSVPEACLVVIDVNGRGIRASTRCGQDQR